MAMAGGLLLLAAAACNGDEPAVAPASMPEPAPTVAVAPAPEPPGLTLETARPSLEASVPAPPTTAPPATAPPTPVSQRPKPLFIPAATPDIAATVAAEVYIRRQVAEQVNAALEAESTPTALPPALEGLHLDLELPPGPLTAGLNPTLEFTATNRLPDPVYDISIEFAPSWPSKLNSLTVNGEACAELACQVPSLAGSESVTGSATLTVDLSLQTEFSLEATAAWHTGDARTKNFFTRLSKVIGPGEGPGSSLWYIPAPALIGTCEKQAAVDYEAVYASFGEMLYAFSRTTGNVLWKFEGEDVLSSPALAGNSIYFTTTVGAGTPTYKNYLYSLNIADGSLNWRSPLERGNERGRPLVHEDAVYVTVRGPFVNYVPEHGHLMSFDAFTGDLNWSLLVEKGASTPPIESGDSIYFFNSASLFRVDPQSGQLEREYSAPGRIYGPPVLHGDKAYITTAGGSIYSWDLATDEIDWEYKPDGGKVSDQPVVSGGQIYFLVYDDVAEERLSLEALDAATGTPLWEYRPGPSLRNPSVDNGRLYVPSRDYLSSLDAETGQTNWTGFYRYICDQVTASEGVLYVRAISNNQEIMLALRAD